jgi:hypothetical protein
MANFTKGSEWEIIKYFNGRSHAEGGIDIYIDDNGISMTNKQGVFKAKGGIVIPALNLQAENPIVQDNTNTQRPVVNTEPASPSTKAINPSAEAQLYPTATTRDKVSRVLTDTGARLLHGVKTFGGSLIGDVIAGIDPKIAKGVSDATLGMISTTPQSELDAAASDNKDRRTNRTRQIGEASKAYVEGVALGYVMNAGENAIIKKFAGALPTTPLFNPIRVKPKITDDTPLNKQLKGVELNPMTDKELFKLRLELKEKGIIKQQKTPNLPWKEPIRKGIEPWGYDSKTGYPLTGSKYRDMKGVIFGGKNPLYITESEFLEQEAARKTMLAEFNLKKGDKVYNSIIDNNKRSLIQQEPSLKKAIDIRDKYRITTVNGKPASHDLAINNRYATWDMYLGKPQTKHPLYDISKLSTKDKIVYTIKEDFMNKDAITYRFEQIFYIIKIAENNPAEFTRIMSSIKKYNPSGVWTQKGNSFIVPNKDGNLFGTMGGFHWDIKPMGDGNYKVMANDIWDLQPFKGTVKLPKIIENIEVGKSLGIGKPLDVQVGFIYDPKNKKIINTFGLAGVAAGSSLTSEKKLTNHINNK